MRIVVFSIVLSSFVSAQTTVAIVAGTPLAAVTIEAGNTVLDSVPAGAAIGGFPNNLSLRSSQTSNGFLSASTLCYPTGQAA